MSHRITKQELKEDKFVHSIFQGYNWSKHHVNAVIGAVVVIVVVLLAVFGFKSYTKNRDQKSINELGLAMQSQRLNNYQEAESKYKEVIETYGSMESGKKARFLLAGLYFEAGMYDNAVEYYKAYLNDPVLENDDMIAASHLGIAASHEDKKEFDEAVKEYQFVYDTYPDYFDRDHVYFSIGRCKLFQNNVQEANEIFANFIEEYKDSPLKEKAQMELWRIRASAM